jgi:cytochrome c oxidase cbb3-type subunit 1
MATFWLLFAAAVGVLMAYKFGAPDFWPGAWLTFGRLRPIHTNDTFYGWASLALVGLAYYVAARSSRTRLYSARLAWTGLALFNLAAAAGTIALVLPKAFNRTGALPPSLDLVPPSEQAGLGKRGGLLQ